MEFRDRAHAQAVYDQQASMLALSDPGFSRGLMNDAQDAVLDFDASLDPFSLNSIKGALGLPVSYGDAVASPPTQNVRGGRVDVDYTVLDDLEKQNQNPVTTEKTFVDINSSVSPAMLNTDENGEGSFFDRTLGAIGDAAGGSPIGTGIRVGTDPDLPTSTRAVGAALPVFTSMMPGFGANIVGGIGSIANAMGFHQDLNAPGTYGLSITPAGNLSGQTQDAGGSFVQSGDLNVSNALGDMQSNQLIDTPFGAQRAQTVADLYKANEGGNPFASEEDFRAAGGEKNSFTADSLAPDIDMTGFTKSDAFSALGLNRDDFLSSLGRDGGFRATNQTMNTLNLGPGYNAVAGAVYDAGGGINDIAPAVAAARQAGRDAINEQECFSNLSTDEAMAENAAGNFGLSLIHI